MNTTESVVTTPANRSDQAQAGMQVERRIVDPAVFQKKYDSMLNLVEFMASLYLMGTRSPKVGKQMGELKSVVEQARKDLNFRPGKTIQKNNSPLSGNGGKHGC